MRSSKGLEGMCLEQTKQTILPPASFHQQNNTPTTPANADMEHSSVTTDPEVMASIPPSTSTAPTLASLLAKIEADGEQVAEITSCVTSYEGLLQAKMKAAKRRSSEQAIQLGNAEVCACSSVAEAQSRVEQRQQDLAKLLLYQHNLKMLEQSMSSGKELNLVS